MDFRIREIVTVREVYCFKIIEALEQEVKGTPFAWQIFNAAMELFVQNLDFALWKYM